MLSGSVSFCPHSVKSISQTTNTKLVTFSGLLQSKGILLPSFEPLIEEILKPTLDGITLEVLLSYDVVFLLDGLDTPSRIQKSQLLSAHSNLQEILFSPWDRGIVPSKPSLTTGLVNFSDPSLQTLFSLTAKLSAPKYSVDSTNIPTNHESKSWSNIVEFSRPVDLGLQRIVPGKK